MTRKKSISIVPLDRVQQQIILLRGQRVILAADLARLYGVTTKRLNQQVTRNANRFPVDFMFQLTPDETAILRAQIKTINVTDRATASRLQIATLNDSSNLKQQSTAAKRGSNIKYLPYAFTEHGAIMAATVLSSPQAVNASLFVVRAFVQLRELLSTHHQLAAKLAELEHRLETHDGQIIALIDAIREMMTEPEDPPKPPIGFLTEIQNPRKQSRASRK